MARANVPPQKLPEGLEGDLRDIPGLFAYLEETQFQQYQMWQRSGGGGDSLADVIDLAADLNQLSAGHGGDIGKLRAVNSAQKKQIDILIALVQVDRQNIADLISDNGKLRARANRTDRELKKIYQLLAGLE